MTSVLGGGPEVGEAGIRVLGVLWLLAAIGFWVASVGALADRDWWTSAAIGVALASLILCFLQWPDSRIGALVDLLIIVAVLLGRRFALITS